MVCMGSNSVIFACILDHHICIAGILILPFCSIFTRKNLCKRGHCYQLMFYASIFKLVECAFSLIVNKLFIIYYARRLWNATYSGSWSQLQRKQLYARKLFTSLVVNKYVKATFGQCCVIHASSMNDEVWCSLLWSSNVWWQRKWQENGLV